MGRTVPRGGVPRRPVSTLKKESDCNREKSRNGPADYCEGIYAGLREYRLFEHRARKASIGANTLAPGALRGVPNFRAA